MSQLPITKKYDFQSVGRLDVDFQAGLIDKALGKPVGIKTPMELSRMGSSGPFKMHDNLASQIKDNFRNMLATNYGDRAVLYDFGANLQELCFELGTEEGDVRAINNIRRTTEKYMPYVTLNTFEPITRSNESGSGLAVIGVRVIYSVPKAGLQDQGVEVIIYAAG